MPCMTELHSLFYVNKVKRVPALAANNIYELLTPVALAHFIMGDGSVIHHGLIICTNNYSIQDVIRLLNVLIIRYRLECGLHLKRQNQKIEYMIYIRQASMPLLRTIVTPYFHPSMYYKIKFTTSTAPGLRSYSTARYAGSESSFIISVHKNSKYKEGYNVQACFSICIHKKDRASLEKKMTIASTPPLRGGDVYSLAGETFYGAGNITKAGLARIQSIKAGMNRGRQKSTWARPQLDQVREDFKSILQRGIHTAPTVKNNSPIKKDNNKLVPIVKHFPASTLEWTNSVFAYNTKKSILFPIIDKIVIKLIKSYFNAYFSSSRPALSARPAAGDRTKIRKLSVLKRMNISKLELKHTNSKVVIVVYVYCAELKNLDAEFLYKNLSDLLAKYYNKKVELRVIRLREMQLNAKILAERLAIELNQRIRSPLRTIRNALKTVRTSKVNIKLYYLKKTSSLIKKYSALYNNISTLNVGDLKKIPKTVRNEVIMSTKYKAITGLKIQIAGRLTRRATAAKAVFKGGQVGGLRNFDSSVLGFSVGLLRGLRNPNIQKSYHNSKTKNGSFNVRV